MSVILLGLISLNGMAGHRIDHRAQQDKAVAGYRLRIFDAHTSICRLWNGYFEIVMDVFEG